MADILSKNSVESSVVYTQCGSCTVACCMSVISPAMHDAVVVVISVDIM